MKRKPIGVPGARKQKGVIPRRLPKRPARVAKPILALAAPAPEHPVVTIDRLKGGELVWSLRVPAVSITRAIDRALAEAARLQKRLDGWKAEQEKYKVDTLAGALRASGARIPKSDLGRAMDPDDAPSHVFPPPPLTPPPPKDRKDVGVGAADSVDKPRNAHSEATLGGG